MNKSTQVEIVLLRKRIARLEKKAAREAAKRQKKLLSLPAKHGFKTVEAFISALSAAAKSAGGKTERRSRAVITPEIKAQVKQWVAAGKTVAEAAAAAGISVPSVMNIKRELGLIRAKK